MGLNVSKGNMYEFITHTWNTVKGACEHDCSYCYMKRWGKLNPARFDEKELKTDLGSGNFIFVGSSNDLFAENIPFEWIVKTLNYMNEFDNKYLIQTKNPRRILEFIDNPIFSNSKIVVCTTIESYTYYPEIMGNSPKPIHRANAMKDISDLGIKTYVTVEPILDFTNISDMVDIIRRCNAEQINIGADTGKHNLPEPTKEKVNQLISELEKFTTIHNKSNLKRLL